MACSTYFAFGILTLVVTFISTAFLSTSADQMPNSALLSGTQSQWPATHQKVRLVGRSFSYVNFLNGTISGFGDSEELARVDSHLSSIHNINLSRLLDVGSPWTLGDSNISYVPPLDGTSPEKTLSFDRYSMGFVLYDLQLANLKSIDPMADTFTAQLQMILQWKDVVTPGADGTGTKECNFLCDTTSSGSSCCDGVWVPPLRLPRCTINKIDSILPTPSVYWRIYHGSEANYEKEYCLSANFSGACNWRRYWHLNVDATCEAHMNFQNFPFDQQHLTIDIHNPYSSRTWLQLAKGSLLHNGGGVINGVLSLGPKIPGWFIKDVSVSTTCDVLSWGRTFLTQNDLLLDLSVNDSKGRPLYRSQEQNITDALQNLKDFKWCSDLKDLNVTGEKNLANPANLQPYNDLQNDYIQRVNDTLANYSECVRTMGKDFYLKSNPLIDSANNLSVDQNDRFFGLLDLLNNTGGQATKVWLPCTIKAVANLTTPGIRITILVQRYGKYYAVKLFIPTVACVAFAFSAFGLKPRDLIGRLTVVVPSAIALTALQGFVVATDIPAVTYVVPTTYLLLASYLAQVLISFESIWINWILNRSIKKGMKKKEEDADSPSKAEKKEDADSPSKAEKKLKEDAEKKLKEDAEKKLRKIDLMIMGVLIILYLVAVFSCLLLPYFKAKTIKAPGVSIWS